VLATDISLEAVALANENAKACNLSDRFMALEADLFEIKKINTQLHTDSHLSPAKNQFDLIVSNPPYIPTAAMDTLPKEVADFEPNLALQGGDDGLDFARRILVAAPSYLKKSCALILELDSRNVDLAGDFAVQLDTYNSVDIASDLTGRRRFLVCRNVATAA
jgi:release factor glutamine methyltransferase